MIRTDETHEVTYVHHIYICMYIYIYIYTLRNIPRTNETHEVAKAFYTYIHTQIHTYIDTYMPYILACIHDITYHAQWRLTRMRKLFCFDYVSGSVDTLHVCVYVSMYACMCACVATHPWMHVARGCINV